MKRASMGVLKIIIPDLDRIWHHVGLIGSTTVISKKP